MEKRGERGEVGTKRQLILLQWTPSAVIKTSRNRKGSASMARSLPWAKFERTTRICSCCGNEMSAANRPRPVRSGRSSSRVSDCPTCFVFARADAGFGHGRRVPPYHRCKRAHGALQPAAAANRRSQIALPSNRRGARHRPNRCPETSRGGTRTMASALPITGRAAL